jgi:trk system potassium uptake protein TrkH
MNFGTQVISMLLMFIGGASGSTAGGVKIVTVGVLTYTVFCNIIGRQDAILFKRRIPFSTFTRAASVVFMQVFLIILSSIAIYAIDGQIEGVDILYEVISAVSTVGLTAGITSVLSTVSQMIIILLMYFGRVGILTVTYALVLNQHSEKSSIRYPDADLLIG